MAAVFRVLSVRARPEHARVKVDVHHHAIPSEALEAVRSEPSAGVRVHDGRWTGGPARRLRARAVVRRPGGQARRPPAARARRGDRLSSAAAAVLPRRAGGRRADRPERSTDPSPGSARTPPTGCAGWPRWRSRPRTRSRRCSTTRWPPAVSGFRSGRRSRAWAAIDEPVLAPFWAAAERRPAPRDAAPRLQRAQRRAGRVLPR